ncbi:MAG TPA: pyridoxamine 5'-phosphate oxidase [Rhodoblastus sp.]|nr:pyridoxamine 5'-phosphate oxidase [Rhodoblastus sp.]
MNTKDDVPKAPFAPLAHNTFDGLALARKLSRAIPVAALATLARDTSYPFVSLTSVASDCDGAPLLLLSGLAHHTKNLRADSRGSLLLTEGGKGDPLAHPRLTIVGRLAPTADSRARARFLRRHPKAALYADFPDFSFWRLEPEAAHLNGGFARAADYSGGDLLTEITDSEALIAAEEPLLEAINAWPRKIRGDLAQAAGDDPSLNWRAVALDPEGLDLAAPQASGRLVLSRRANDPAAWKEALAEAIQAATAPG